MGKKSEMRESAVGDKSRRSKKKAKVECWEISDCRAPRDRLGGGGAGRASRVQAGKESSQQKKERDLPIRGAG